MLELSLKEQKQINGGSYVVKVYDSQTHRLVSTRRGFNTLQDAQHYAETWDSYKYTITVGAE